MVVLEKDLSEKVEVQTEQITELKSKQMEDMKQLDELENQLKEAEKKKVEASTSAEDYRQKFESEQTNSQKLQEES